MLKRIFLILLALIPVSILSLLLIGGGMGRMPERSVFNSSETNYIAHRGLYNYFAENSFEGYENCRLMGFKSIETDIRVSKDNHLIVFHDDSTQRLLGVNSTVEELTLAELERIHLLFNGQATKNTVMSLNTFLKSFQNDFVIYLDNKVNKKWVADSLLSQIKKSKAQGSVIVASSNLLFLSYIKYKNPDIFTALEGFNAGKEWIYSLVPKKFKPDYYSSFVSKIDDKHLEFLRENQLLNHKIVYGVDRENLNYTLQSGIGNMILDFDSSFVEILPQHDSLHQDKK
ncbi:MAG: hypothetical protein EYC69_01455 [Bacteroidetes bacterium]|nr:MAG: hypothetical protein EYC69_01455 [Bacteroidota bacterium]